MREREREGEVEYQDQVTSTFSYYLVSSRYLVMLMIHRSWPFCYFNINIKQLSLMVGGLLLVLEQTIHPSSQEFIIPGGTVPGYILNDPKQSRWWEMCFTGCRISVWKISFICLQFDIFHKQFRKSISSILHRDGICSAEKYNISLLFAKSGTTNLCSWCFFFNFPLSTSKYKITSVYIFLGGSFLADMEHGTL